MMKEQKPARIYKFPIKIWDPKNWKIVSTNYNGKPVYHAEQYDVVEVSTAYPGYRILQFLVRTWKWWKNAFYWLVLVFLIHGPLSFRALFSIHSYYPSRMIDSNTGELVVDKSECVETYMSRIHGLWDNISESREKFESSPDDGILGKSISRLFNVFWNYIVKGFFGTLLLLIGFPLLCILNFSVTLVIILLAPIWGPFLSLCQYLCCLLIFDFDNPFEFRIFFPYILIIIWEYLILGASQILLSIFCILVIHPLVAMVVSLFAIIRTTISTATDLFTFYLILKRAGRVPASNSFLAERTEGPGLNQQWYYQVTTDVALLALQAYLEKEELKIYRTITEKKIEESMQKLRQIESEIFSQFGLRFDLSHPVYKSIQECNNQIREELKKKFNASPFNNTYFPNNIKQTTAALVETMEQGAILVQEFYPKHIFNLMSEEQITQFWVDSNLAPDDWTGLTKILFSQTFPGTDFLRPLEIDDKSFSLKVSHVGVRGFVEMIVKANPRDDLELKTAEYALVNSSYLSKRPVINLLTLTVPFFNINYDNKFKSWLEKDDTVY